MRILLGVTGGVAAYKAAELVRELQRRSVEVQVAMTPGAEEFVRPLTFAALSGWPVLTSLWTPATDAVARQGGAEEFGIEHIAVAQRIDALVIAPATANMLARLAHGLADDLLSTVALATKAPVLVAPAMNVNMWEHQATQANVRILLGRGVRVVEPAAGYLACGMTGGGRLAEPVVIADAVLQILAPVQDLEGETLLITAGGTREPIDPVRFLGNRSSGKMGHALAEAALARGARVRLVTAAANTPALACEITQVDTAEHMRMAVLAQVQDATIVIGAAAVSDFRPTAVSASKLKRTAGLHLDLEPTADIIREVASLRDRDCLVVAFAAETGHLMENARRKLREKGVDAVVANDVSGSECGFDSEWNAGCFVTAATEMMLPQSSKRMMADRILDSIIQMKIQMKRKSSKRAAHTHQEGDAVAIR